MTSAGSSNPAHVLVIEDDETARVTVAQILEGMGLRVTTASRGDEGLALLDQAGDMQLVLTDVVMPGMDGIEVLQRLRQEHPQVAVVIMTAFASVSRAVTAMRLGAVDYLEKPLQLRELRGTVERALAHAGAGLPRQPLEITGAHFGCMVGRAPAMRQVYETIQQVAPSRASVLIQGESGTGKELIAREIHSRSLRGGELVAVHCASLTETLIESELFGHVKGAFTDARADRKGRFEEADGGTLFLDEISEVPTEMQVKLLRALQEREITRVGESRSRKVDVRIISATNQDLRAEMEGGRIRQDLYFRIAVVRIQVPPLRERKEDIPALVEHFRLQKNQVNDRVITGVTAAALAMLQAYEWPGNVRELENVIENGVVMARGTEIIPELLPLEVQLAGRRHADAAPDSGPLETAAIAEAGDRVAIPIGTPLADVEREMILRTLDEVGGNKTTAAKILGIGARTLYRKLEQYGVHTRNPADDPEEE
jgi:DNA-binding NtrC family response regulator